jgi:acetyltransferase-like isoleucine patch superfamily enzyme
VLIGAGAVILPGLTIASDVVVGAGAVVTRSIENAGTFIGTPAREVSRG